MSDPLYTKDILRLAADIPHLKRLDSPDASVTRVSPICGSKINVDVMITDDVVTDFGQNVRACALGQASAAILGRHILGTPLHACPALHDTLALFLKGQGDAPEGDWADLKIFAPAKNHKSRHASILLGFAALADIAMDQAKVG